MRRVPSQGSQLHSPLYTETQIRALAINFLRRHYRHRPRSGTSGTRVVYRPHYYKGVTIDARLAFQRPDLSWFMAMIEATPVDRSHEILFRINWFRAFAYGLLLGLMLTAAGLALAQVQGVNVWLWFDGPLALGAMALLIIGVTGLTALLLHRRPAYRYIYAIEQFKRFYADAQWIAYDPEIFVDRHPMMRDELRRQVILGGFGLMEVLPGNRVRDIIEPSHLDQFGGHRSSLPLWVAAIQPPPKLRSLAARLPFANPSTSGPAAEPRSASEPDHYLPTSIRPDDYAATLHRANPGRPKWYRQPRRRLKRLRWKARDAYRRLYPFEIRRRPGYYDLPWWYFPSLLAAFATIVVLTISQASWQSLTVPGTAYEVPSITGLEPAARPELSQARPELLPGEYDHERHQVIPPPPAPAAPELVVPKPESTPLQYHVDPNGTVRTDHDCVSLHQFTDSYFLIIAGAYPNFVTARTEADRLAARYHIPVAATAEQCLRLGGQRYFVHLAEPTTDESRANFLIRQFIRDHKLDVEVMIIE